MQRVFNVRIYPGKSRLNSFTLVELLVVMAIIGILVAITLEAASGVMAAAARKRAMGEITAMTTALESYKNDNGAYPQSSTMLTNTAASPYSSSTVDGSSATYITTSQIIYQALSGQTNFLDTPVSGVKAYMSFKVSMIGNASSPAGSGTSATTSYIQDPWSYSYGYSTGSTNGAPTPSYPYNGSGFFDLWSTAGLLAPAATNSSAWISNWQ